MTLSAERLAEIRRACEQVPEVASAIGPASQAMLRDLLAAYEAATVWTPIEEMKLRATPFLAAVFEPTGYSREVGHLIEGEIMASNGHYLENVTHFQELSAPPAAQEKTS